MYESNENDGSKSHISKAFGQGCELFELRFCVYKGRPGQTSKTFRIHCTVYGFDVSDDSESDIESTKNGILT